MTCKDIISMKQYEIHNNVHCEQWIVTNYNFPIQNNSMQLHTSIFGTDVNLLSYLLLSIPKSGLINRCL